MSGRRPSVAQLRILHALADGTPRVWWGGSSWRATHALEQRGLLSQGERLGDAEITPLGREVLARYPLVTVKRGATSNPRKVQP